MGQIFNLQQNVAQICHFLTEISVDLYKNLQYLPIYASVGLGNGNAGAANLAEKAL